MVISSPRLLLDASFFNIDKPPSIINVRRELDTRAFRFSPACITKTATRAWIEPTQTVLEIQGSASSPVTANQIAVSELGTQLDTLSATIVAQAELLAKVGSELSDFEQYSRRCNFEVHGLSYNPNEDMSWFLSELAAKLNFSELKATDLSAVHILPARSNTIPATLVQMRAVSATQEWLSARGVLREPAQDRTSPRLYFNDNLSRAQRELHRLAWQKGEGKKNQLSLDQKRQDTG